MSATRNTLLFLALIIIATVHSQPADPNYPPPDSIDYHNDTLMIYPPNSIPGEPVVLLGYNIYVDSVFYDNVMISNPSDTVYFISDLSTLFPGNHIFCVNALYNEWISDPTCDSALVIYGYELPFLEDWSSGDFTENHWITNSGNWTVKSDEGNPGPAAVFSGMPVQQNYEIPLESYAFRGDLLHVGSGWISFDIKLLSNNNTGNEKLMLQRWNWNDEIWQNWEYYSNQSGSFSWSNKIVPLYSNSGSGPIFKIRFLAIGLNSADISSWSIDNIHIYRTCHNVADLYVNENWDYNELYWSPPTGCWDQWIHWDDGINSGNSIGTGSAVEFDVAARWTPTQLSDYQGLPVSHIKFFPAEVSASYNVRIWSGDSIVNLVFDQPISDPQIGEWNDITLSPPVEIDYTKDLYVGYHIKATTGYPAGVDDGPAIEGFGNMMHWEGVWRTLLEINPDLDYNWNIECLLGTPPEYPVRYFNIYRETNFEGGFQFIDNVYDEPIYKDSNIYLPDFYCYKVTMVWSKSGDTCESVASNEACEIWSLNTDEPGQDHLIKIYPNPSKDWLNIEADEVINHIRFYSLLGELILESEINQPVYRLDVSGLPDMIYYLVAETDKRQITEKIVVLK
jgi:hypothetical protein